jgi:hypothetical protein
MQPKARAESPVSKMVVFGTAQALSRFGKAELLSGHRWNKRVVHHAVNQAS